MIQETVPSFNAPRLKLNRVAPTPRRIYAYLLCAEGRRVPVDELVTRILNYPADRYARATVHTHVCYLRRALPAGVAIRYRREPGDEGYELVGH